MTLKELHNRLIDAYSVNNLNSISLTLINLFKNKDYQALQRIGELINDTADVNVGKNGKGFSRLMMLYHPDRAVYHLTEINRLAAENDYDGLLKYAHILKLDRIGDLAASMNSYDDMDYSPVYDWDLSDLEEEGFRIFDVNSPDESIFSGGAMQGRTFLEAVLTEFGDDADPDYAMAWLGNYDDFDLSSSGINDLDGVQFCINARTLDVSDNMISDLLPLSDLKDLEELNISYNNIGYIDDITGLKKLRSIMLSNNCIEDISPLLELEKLEYADVSGNRIDEDQIDELISLGVTVDY